MKTTGPANALDLARADAGLSAAELWLRYFALGGMSTPIEVDGYLFGALEPTLDDRNRLVHAINERHVELGENHPVPYADESEN
jgi:hypothetical protein